MLESEYMYFITAAINIQVCLCFAVIIGALGKFGSSTRTFIKTDRSEKTSATKSTESASAFGCF